jgi:hypothetical protein
MRFNFLLLLACVLLGACASEDIAVTGIPRARAIAIATLACKEYPGRFPVADRAKWIRDGGYWVVDITDSYREHGRFFMVDRHGKIIGKGRIPQESAENEGPVYRGRPAYEEERPYYNEDPRPYYHSGPYYDERPYRRGWY